jgi:hypothetical protein
MSAMAIQRGFRPLYKPMNSLAEKGVFRFAKMALAGGGDQRTQASSRKSPFFPDSCIKQLRITVWTGVTRDTRPEPEVAAACAVSANRDNIVVLTTYVTTTIMQL